MPDAWAARAPPLRRHLRKAICSTNAIEIFNARFRKAVRARGRLSNEAVASRALTRH
ncbi:transposase [Streptomyces sp. SKN60]|uniref:transposase n=1 Tax=Streptomyces sp. SKN60 TaxID=2855506 RepID=UPI0027E57193|nr:transposase [Streptomyces sp. SKN60]